MVGDKRRERPVKPLSGIKNFSRDSAYHARPDIDTIHFIVRFDVVREDFTDPF